MDSVLLVALTVDVVADTTPVTLALTADTGVGVSPPRKKKKKKRKQRRYNYDDGNEFRRTTL